MTASDPESLKSHEGPSRFRLLATFIAGRSVDVAEAPAGQAAHTNGQVVFVSSGRSVGEQRREMLVQSALLGAGSLDQRLVKALRTRPSIARRYLALEGRRVLAELAGQLPIAALLDTEGEPSTATPDESLQVAKSRTKVAEAPEWFGVIRPSRLLTSAAATRSAGHRQRAASGIRSTRLTRGRRRSTMATGSRPRKAGCSNFLKIHSSTHKLFRTTSASFSAVRVLQGTALPAPSCRFARCDRWTASEQMPGRCRRGSISPMTASPGAAVGVGGALYPEWDVFSNRYRPQWCRVIDFPLTAAPDMTSVSAAGVPHDDVLRRRLSRVGLGPKVLRGRPDGDELDLESLIDLFVDLRSGYSPPENVYLERRKLARNLGVLILLDASGSATDTDPDGLAVHDHQRRAGATLAATLEDLGDRVALYAFRSQGRHAVHLPVDQGIRATFRRRRAGSAQPARTLGLHASRRWHSWRR